MYELFFADGAAWYTLPAVLGTMVFALRLVSAGIGASGVELDVDFDHGDSGDAFTLLSFQSLAAFAMGFGWGGLGALKGTGFSPLVSTLVGVACGVGMVYLLAVLLRSVRKLQVSGNVRIDDAVGVEGSVYVAVPGNATGSGQVRLVINGRDRVLNATTPGEALSRGARVRVLRANEDNTVTVTGV